MPEANSDGAISLEQTLQERRSIRSFRDGPLEEEQLAQLLWAAQGVTDPGRGFRTAPSAGATYPLETHLVTGEGVYRYDPGAHALAKRIDRDVRGELASAAFGQRFVGSAPASIIFTAVYARTASRYGGRARRYVHMEAGHAAQNVHLQAVALGLGSVPVGAFNDADVAGILELNGNEEPLYIIPVGIPR